MRPLTNWLQQTKGILRDGQLSSSAGRDAFLPLIWYVLVFGALYGAAMGSFGGVTGERFWQVVYAALKVPLLLLLTFALSLPSFFVLNTLFGLRRDFPTACRAVLVTQAGLSVVLGSLAPLVLFWYASFGNYRLALCFNGLMFAMASVSSQILLRRCYQPLIERNKKHRLLVRIWLVVYIFVAIQLSWVLRPFVGAPGIPVQFVRTSAWGNAYIVVLELLWDTARGLGRH